tara:strand:- start:1388 stop:1549 length:162 start_codon:yes stop_codon:yes gene_type:complete
MSLYENIHKRRKSGKPMRQKGAKGAPSDADFKAAARTAAKKGKYVRKKKKAKK